MKALVAATCIAVLAFVGYFFWNEYEKRSARNERAASIEHAHTEIMDLAKGAAGLSDAEKARNYCSVLERSNRNNPTPSSAREQIIKNCRRFGYL